MLKTEQNVLNKLVDAHNKYIELPMIHKDDIND